MALETPWMTAMHDAPTSSAHLLGRLTFVCGMLASYWL